MNPSGMRDGSVSEMRQIKELLTPVLCECYPLSDGQQTGSMNQHARLILDKDQFSRRVYFTDPQKLGWHSQGRATNRDDLAETEVT